MSKQLQFVDVEKRGAKYQLVHPISRIVWLTQALAAIGCDVKATGLSQSQALANAQSIEDSANGSVVKTRRESKRKKV